MNRRVTVNWLQLSIASFVALLSVSLAGAGGGRQMEDMRKDTSVRSDITPFGIVPTETVRVCITGLPIERRTDSLRWSIRFITTNGEVVATEQLEVPHRGFKCADLSYEEARIRTATMPLLEPTGRLQLAVQAAPLLSSSELLAWLKRGSPEISNIGTVEIVAASGQTLVVAGRFGMKTLSL